MARVAAILAGLLAGTVLTASFWLRASVGAGGHDPSRSVLQAQTTAPDGAAAGAGELARRMLGALAEPRFTGVIDFDYESTVLREPADVVVQSGRLYVGPKAHVRLDVWVAGSPDPVICCVSPSDVWMVFGTSPLVYRSAYPLAGSHNGWLGQMEAQAQQTLCWADLFLGSHLSARASSAIEAARLVEGGLHLRLAPGDPSYWGGAAEVRAEFVPGAGLYYPTLVRLLDRDGTLTLGDHQVVAPGRAVPGRLESVAHTGRAQVRSLWTVLGIEHMDVTEVAAFLRPPCSRSEEYPHVIGECYFDRDGKESPTVWQ